MKQQIHEAAIWQRSNFATPKEIIKQQLDHAERFIVQKVHKAVTCQRSNATAHKIDDPEDSCSNLVKLEVHDEEDP